MMHAALSARASPMEMQGCSAERLGILARGKAVTKAQLTALQSSEPEGHVHILYNHELTLP